MNFTSNDIKEVKRKYNIVGNSQQLDLALWRALMVAGTDLSVLIVGENGTGKESISKLVHDYSFRRHNAMVKVNCGAIPSGTIDSELFGHEKGAFTDAIGKRKGYFEEANKGTIFLDEIAELPLETQAKLLRVLENKEIMHVGSSQVQKVDIRIIAATNKNLQRMVYEGKFREDLFYRLNTVQINLPSLRERGEDILLLFSKFANDFAAENKMEPIHLKDEAQAYIFKYSFPGNVRQLKNLAESMSVFETKREIDIPTLKTYLNVDENFPVNVSTNYKNHDYKIEIELLYKMIIDLKKNQEEMKSVILKILHDANGGSDIVADHKSLFSMKKELGEIGKEKD